MRSSFLLLLAAALSAWQCGNAPNHVDLYTGQKFRIERGEIVAGNTSEIIPQYNLLFNSYKDVQIPLLTFIKHNDYGIVIGLPVGTTKADLFEKICREPSNKKLIFERPNNDSYLMKYEKENHFVITYISALKDSTIICFSAMASDPGLIDGFFNKNIFKERLYE